MNQQSRRPGWPLMHWCCANGHVKAVRTLFQRVTGEALETMSDTRFPDDLNVPGVEPQPLGPVPYRLTALGVAIYTDRGDLMDVLLEAGASVSNVSRPACPALTAAVKFNRLGLVKRLLALPPGASGNAGIDARDANGWTALTHALCRGDQMFMEVLLEAGASLPTALTGLANIDSRGLFLKAVLAGNGLAVTKLIETGLDPDARDDEVNTPLQLSCTRCPDPAPVITALLQTGRVDVNVMDVHQTTPLIHLVSRNGPQAARGVQVLLDHPGLNVSHRDSFNGTALIYALSNRDMAEPALRMIDMTAPADLHVVNGMGRTLLFPACRSADTRPLRRLLELGLNPNTRAIWGHTVFKEACSNNLRDALRVLLAIPGIDMGFEDGGPPALLEACDNGYWAMAGVLAAHPAIPALAPVSGGHEYYNRVESLRTAVTRLFKHPGPIRGLPVPKDVEHLDSMLTTLVYKLPVTPQALWGKLPPVDLALAWESGAYIGTAKAAADYRLCRVAINPEARRFISCVVLPWLAVVAPKLGLGVVREAPQGA